MAAVVTMLDRDFCDGHHIGARTAPAVCDRAPALQRRDGWELVMPNAVLPRGLVTRRCAFAAEDGPAVR